MTTLKLDIDEYGVFTTMIKEENRDCIGTTVFEERIIHIVLDGLLKRLVKKGIDHTLKKRYIKLKLDEVEVNVLHQFLDDKTILPAFAYSLVVSIIEQLNPLIID